MPKRLRSCMKRRFQPPMMFFSQRCFLAIFSWKMEYVLSLLNIYKYVDMVSMEALNEAEILWNLKYRYLKDSIFTYIGPTLIVMYKCQLLSLSLETPINLLIRYLLYIYTKITQRIRLFLISKIFRHILMRFQPKLIKNYLKTKRIKQLLLVEK